MGIDLQQYESAEDEEVLEYIVMNEHTLGCLFKANTIFYIGVLHGSILRGGRFVWWGPLSISPLDNIRKATIQDFHDYNVMPPKDLEIAAR